MQTEMGRPRREMVSGEEVKRREERDGDTFRSPRDGTDNQGDVVCVGD